MIGKWLFVAEFAMGCALIIVFFASLGTTEMWGVPTNVFVSTVLFYCLCGWWGLYLVASIVSIVEAVRFARRDDLVGLRRAMLLVKLSSIPFFVLNFVLAGSVAVVTSFIGAVVVVPMTYLLMVLSSAYGIACLVVLLRRRAVPKWFFGVCLAAQFLFVLDIVSTVAAAIAAAGARRPAPQPAAGNPSP